MPDLEDIVRRVYVHLEQLASNPPPVVYEDDVDRYYALLDRLEGAGFDAQEFRFDLKRDMYESTYGGKEMRPDVFARMVSAILRYFEVRDKPVIYTGPLKG